MQTTRRILLFTLLVVFLATSFVVHSQTALQFVAVTPCRVVDTRLAPGPFGGPALQGQTSRDFTIPDSACSIPNTAAAYSLNVAVVPHEGLGYLTVWPAGQPRPTIATLNSVDGRVKANAAIIPAGSGEAISVYATQTTDVVLDIDGYFVPATSATLAFFPLTPCRVADTRWTTGPLGGPYLTGGEERAFPVLSSSCNIPDTAQAYSLNFAAIPYGPLGYLTVWPTGESKPLVSTLNALTGTITANGAIVPSGQQGAISVYPSSATDLVIDIDGYFAPADSAPDPLSLYALAPCRVLDTRQTTGAFSGTLPVSVLQSGCQVPSAQAYVLNATVVPQNGQPLGYLTLWPDAEDKPVVATLNALDGAITSNMAIVSTLNGFIDAYATSPTDLVVDIFSYFAPIGSLDITTTSLPSGTLNYPYSMTLGATGGVTPYSWSIPSGSLPPGLNLDPTSGVISGMTTTVGSYPFTVQVSGLQSPPATASAPLSIAVNATLTQLSIVTTSLPSGTQNQTYSAMLAATGGLTPYTWSVTAGSLPVGLHLNANSGAITGTPSGAGISNLTVQVTDSNSPPATASAPLSITIAPAVALSITTTFLPAGTTGGPYSGPITAIGGVYPYTWSVISGSLPSGLSLGSSTGVISGTPQNVGQSNFTVKVVDSETPPVSATAQLSITINSYQVSIDAQSPVLATVSRDVFGVNLTSSMDLTNGNPNYNEMIATFQNAKLGMVRWPLALLSDYYHWQTNSFSSCGQEHYGPLTSRTTFDQFMQQVAQPLDLDVNIIINYGSNADCTGGGDPNEAAAWVDYANNQMHYGIKYWSIGNEQYYGSPILGPTLTTPDFNVLPGSPGAAGSATYANLITTEFYPLMKAMDPSIQIGVDLVVPDNNASSRTVPWDSTVLANANFDFVEVHWYGASPPQCCDQRFGLAECRRFIFQICSRESSIRTCGGRESEHPHLCGGVGNPGPK
jgi:Putative Ig domain